MALQVDLKVPLLGIYREPTKIVPLALPAAPALRNITHLNLQLSLKYDLRAQNDWFVGILSLGGDAADVRLSCKAVCT